MFETVPKPETMPARATTTAKQWFMRFIAIAIIVAIGVWIGSLYQDLRQVRQELALVKSDPQAAATKENANLAAEVGKLIALPADEEPTVATVLDKEKLKDQPFFAKVENGDKVLIYQNAKKVYLYRQADKKVIEVGTINLEQTGQANQSANR